MLLPRLKSISNDAHLRIQVKLSEPFSYRLLYPAGTGTPELKPKISFKKSTLFTGNPTGNFFTFTNAINVPVSFLKIAWLALVIATSLQLKPIK